MRFGRILLASLTALVACSYAQDAPASAREITRTDSLRLLRVVVPLFVSAAESVAPAPVRHSTQAVLTLEALAETPLSGAVCLVASLLAVNLLTRRHQRALLRC